MTDKQLSWLALGLIALVLIGTSLSSSMPYEAQSLQPVLRQVLAGEPFAGLLRTIQFSYAGEKISIEALSYAGFVEFFIRKGVHFVLFGSLAVLIYLALRPYCQGRGLTVFLSLALTFGFASFDELHQTLTTNRSGLVEDVLLDAAGALTFLLIYQVLEHIFRRKPIK
ncbi:MULTISPECIES: VanZ family protein [Aerococcus]|uniref:VanZ family protein n=1 Tax=Aerococcus sanguinicola TaxID=119206 RepID=A0A5N1GN23_9LACT|nr:MULTISPECIES: VanZ family protein [Aerococcus]KAA9302192.1 VanZ family protein [Aerococcus sanguinicola]MDK6368378.1 VanZ family protein [Aerococcus sp. UMB9870]MDK6679460.1 VanZ family protein [Aerococcus sp. UMB8608]MDK6941075.1 VanZ family protein [Aerococcus sp. UMB8487]OFK21119.1 hypothetical protein HMPREF2829_06495 [Aerococcus sp. HMSC072A12]